MLRGFFFGLEDWNFGFRMSDFCGVGGFTDMRGRRF